MTKVSDNISIPRAEYNSLKTIWYERGKLEGERRVREKFLAVLGIDVAIAQWIADHQVRAHGS